MHRKGAQGDPGTNPFQGLYGGSFCASVSDVGTEENFERGQFISGVFYDTSTLLPDLSPFQLSPFP